MKEMLLAAIAIVVISVGAYYALHEVGFSSAEQGSGPAVRLGE